MQADFRLPGNEVNCVRNQVNWIIVQTGATMRLLIDAHLDLAMNAIYYDRDITRNLTEMNSQEADLRDFSFRSRGTVTLPELRAANLGICFATLLARSGPRFRFNGTSRRSDLDFGLRAGAYCCCHAQLAYYRLLERRGELKILLTQEDLDQHLQFWNSTADHTRAPIGIVLTMEGADPVLEPRDVDHWYAEGLRAIGLTHYGYSHYGAGTRVEGPLTDAGREILPSMERLHMALDITHLSDESMAEAFDRFHGVLWASHHNCRALVPWDRQLTDDQIRIVGSRNGVIGVAADAIMLHPDWIHHQSTPEALGVKISHMVDHIDRIVDLTASTLHVGIGTDLDGGYGSEQTPQDLKAYRDVRRIEDLLARRGYQDSEIENIFSGNWLRLLRLCLPEAASLTSPSPTRTAG
jgi:membrane dipeptidase